MNDTTKRDRRIKAIVITSIIVVILIAAFVLLRINHKQEDIFEHANLHSRITADSGDGYELEQMLIVSRHNIRSPLSGGDSLLSQITPHEWFDWTSNPGELSVKGGQLETTMGQFFRKYLEAKGLIPENWIPEDGEVRFYANSMQRTIATSEFFAGGMLPVGNPEIEYHMEYGEVDPIFCPIIQYNNPAFEAQVRSEISAMGGDGGMIGIGRNLKKSFTLLEKVLDFKDSRYAKENNITEIPTDDIEIELTPGEEVKLTGGLKIANSAVDALKLQIYEEEDPGKALFGHELTEDEIKTICSAGDMYQEICEGSKTLSTQVMHSMIEEIAKELDTPKRKFTFLCGHDSTLTALVSALDIEEYELPGAISCKAPIGGKMVFEKYRGVDGNKYIKVFMCYNSTDQLRKCAITSLDDAPMIYYFQFDGLEKNADGYYSYEDVISRFNEALDHYYDYYEEPVSEAA